ncbi:NAD-dependent epimerase/dehydratase family protein [Nitrospiraceae bacterium AH_259_D15_M11_P09]|nr:NAD-dependent epimerase/dehydratase family protein [Nitrospiraceae bacterium AH_259_D15_M11_P09]
MRVLVLGGDGYLGWPTAMYFSNCGHEVMVVDSLAKRYWEQETGGMPLFPVTPLHQRVRHWREITGKTITERILDIATNDRYLYYVLDEFRPEAIIHYAEQPSAPFSMISRQKAVQTQQNNVIGTLNLLFAIKSRCPDAHLVKLGTMGEYGTPNIDIEEGFLQITHNGRTDTLPFPKQPGSFYHLSKVHDSHNIMFACKVWGLRATDLNQGVVYGIETDETELNPELLRTSFHYDAIFGTALNRFCAQAALASPLTVYGKGGQTRGFLNIRDTIQCVDLTVKNPPKQGDYQVFNQFTEVLMVRDLAERVKFAGAHLGLHVKIDNIPNPRNEQEEHYYNPKHTKLTELGLKPRFLSDVLLEEMLTAVIQAKGQVDEHVVYPSVKWREQ